MPVCVCMNVMPVCMYVCMQVVPVCAGGAYMSSQVKPVCVCVYAGGACMCRWCLYVLTGEACVGAGGAYMSVHR